MNRIPEEEIDRFIEKYHDEIIENVCDFVRIPSVADEEVENFPYGEKCAEALDFCIRLAKEKGLYVENYDYYGVEIRPWEVQNGKKLLWAAHADVVPASKENIYPPFEGTVDKNYIIGRGVVDDKAPLIALLYAIAFLKDQNIHPNCDVRLFIGSHEETDMEDLKYYLKKVGQPDFGIAADDDFPITNGEKSVIWFRLSSNKNCIELWEKLAKDKTGIMFNIDEQNEIYGHSVCKLKNRTETLAEFDVRIPISLSICDAKQRICKFAEQNNLSVEFLKSDEGYYISDQEGIPKLLVELYNHVSKQNLPAYIMEGCTYARHFERGCGFGAGNPEEIKPFPKGHGSAHGSDEAQNIDVLMYAIKMYIMALGEIDEYWSRENE